MKKIKVHNKSKLPTCNYNEFIELQDDFKTRTSEEIEKLANRIIEVGFKYPAFVWIDEKGVKWTVDAHGRKESLQYLKEQSFEIPKIPYVEIYAKNKAEAEKEILYLNSNYGIINKESGFFGRVFVPEIDINVNIPNVIINNYEEFEGNIDDFFEENTNEQETKVKTIDCPSCGKVIELK
jgi:hypothetical protein